MERIVVFIRRALLWARIYNLDIQIAQFGAVMTSAQTVNVYLNARYGKEKLESERAYLRSEYQATFPIGHRITWAY